MMKFRSKSVTYLQIKHILQNDDGTITDNEGNTISLLDLYAMIQQLNSN